MKIKDILQLDVVFTERYWDLELLAKSVCAYEPYLYDYIHETDVKITQSWVDRRMCTDTWVGTSILMFDSKPFAVSSQRHRKSDTHILLFDEEIAKEVRTYLESLLEYDTITVHSLDECIDNYL